MGALRDLHAILDSGDLDELTQFQAGLADLYLNRKIKTEHFHDIHANICVYLASRE